MNRPDFEGFVRELMDGWPEPKGENLDGFDLQEIAARFHILRVDKRRTPCSEWCNCVEYHGADEIVDCYRLNYPPERSANPDPLMPITARKRSF